MPPPPTVVLFILIASHGHWDHTLGMERLAASVWGVFPYSSWLMASDLSGSLFQLPVLNRSTETESHHLIPHGIKKYFLLSALNLFSVSFIG